MLELKPCPFCGGKATAVFTGRDKIKMVVQCREYLASSGISHRLRDDAAKEWNRRTEPLADEKC